MTYTRPEQRIALLELEHVRSEDHGKLMANGEDSARAAVLKWTMCDMLEPARQSNL